MATEGFSATQRIFATAGLGGDPCSLCTAKVEFDIHAPDWRMVSPGDEDGDDTGAGDHASGDKDSDGKGAGAGGGIGGGCRRITFCTTCKNASYNGVRVAVNVMNAFDSKISNWNVIVFLSLGGLTYWGVYGFSTCGVRVPVIE